MVEGHSKLYDKERSRSLALPTQVLSYGVAVVSVASALGTNLLLKTYLAPTPTSAFFAAVMLSAWYGGLGAGLLATALSTLSINYFYIQPLYSFEIINIGHVIRLSIFVMAALLISSLNEAQRSAQRKAETSLQALCESEARFGCLAESNILGMVVVDLDGPVLEANANFLQMVGYSQDDLRLGRMCWREMTTPESLDVSEQAVQELLTTGVSTPFEKEYICKDGSRVAVLYGAVMTGHNTATGFVLDLSDRKRIETSLQRTNQTLQTLIDACPIAIVFLEPTGIVRLWNRAAERISGWSAEETVGQFMPSMPYRQQEFLACIEAVLSGRSLNGVKAQYWRKDGQRVNLQIWASLTHDADGNPGCLGIAWDVTEQQRAADLLRSSEERYRLLVTTTTALVWSADPTGQFVNPQPSWEAYTGQGWPEHAGWGWLMMFHPDDREPLKACWQTSLAEQSSYTAQGRLWHAPSRQYRHIVAHAVPLLNPDGSVREWIGMDTDMHEQQMALRDRKQAEAALRASEERFQLIAQASNDVMWDCDLITQEMWWSDRLHLVFGYQPEELGVNMAGWAERVHADDLERVQASYRACLDSSTTVWSDEYRFRRADGSYASVLDRAFVIRDSAGCPVRVVGAMSDISNRKQAEDALRQSEERLRLALDAGCMGAWEWNLETNVQQWDVNQYKLFGMDKDQNQLSAEAFFQFIHPDDRLPAEQLTERVLAQGGGFHTEFRIITPDGTVRWLSSQGIVVHDDTNRPIRLIGVNFDVTERKREEAERERLLKNEQLARQEAEAANRIKDEFLAVLSHELRSPLNPILGWSRLLQTQKLDEQMTRQALATIERNAKLQTQLIEDLLDVSRILRGKLVLNIAPVSLTGTIEAALETVRLAVEAKGIHVKTEFNLVVDQVMGDAARLQQVVWNVLSNAVKFTPSGGAIEIRLEQVNRYAQIQVKDTGKGISPDFLPYVFDYFRQEDSSTIRKFGGLGLGLAIVHHITELHGGTVWAESLGEGSGATFFVQLPLPAFTGTGNAVEQEPTVLAAFPHGLLDGLRVLAVDDDDDIRVLIEFILRQAGAEVCSVATAAEALEQLLAFSPDVLISDIGMPDVDGYSLMRQINARRAEAIEGVSRPIKAIALTAYAGEIDQQQAIAAGFQRHLAKPIEPETLIYAISDVVGR